MPKIGNEDWVQLYVKALNDNPAYLDAAKTWEGDFIFTLEPEGPLDHKITFFLGLFHGKATGGRALKEGDPEPKAEFKVGGKYLNWVKVFKKQIDPVQALMQGKLKLTGNMAKVMRAVKAAQELVNTLSMIDTQYY
jgi:putative sterol carrier protein